MCSAADDPTTYDTDRAEYEAAANDLWNAVTDPLSGSLGDAWLETAIARRNLAWVVWQDEADELYNRVTDGERPHFGPYNDAQKAYEHAVSDLMREQARWNHSRHA
jgi:hypothetical protein